ncbi:TIGR02444 family protein [Pseudomonas alcaligenes]|uniref:TIGR02444 family protein n=1 Tax=Aquipseudomonas alcaligenes TaxID=43263 RepID=A0ABR7S6W1_AQUAC|nr:TIGR02444 family protein [Pseudomonas alcaligenes]MBC9252772.1 TIGR02444 family protein [Pseudomonas alcaligenes]
MPSDLWSFASCCYARPGVEAACLQLQAQGADVCLLLCGLWLEQRGVDCSDERRQQLVAISEPWQRQVICPLRELRQGWRAAAQLDAVQLRLREQIKAMELEAERELLARLERLAGDWPTRADQQSAWLEALSGVAATTCRDALQLLRAAATPT